MNAIEFIEKDTGFVLNRGQKQILSAMYPCGIFDCDSIFNEFAFAIGRRSGKDQLLAFILLIETRRLFALIHNEKILGLNKENILSLNLNNCVAILSAPTSHVAQILESTIKYTFLKSHYFNSFANKNKLNDIFKMIRIVNINRNTCKSLLGLTPYFLAGNEFAFVTKKYAREFINCFNPIINIYSNLGFKSCFISTPRKEPVILKKKSIFYQMMQPSPKRLAMSLSTWQFNSKYTQDQLRKDFSNLPDDDFDTEFGVQFKKVKTEQITFRLKSEIVSALKNDSKKRGYKNTNELIRKMINKHLGLH